MWKLALSIFSNKQAAKQADAANVANSALADSNYSASVAQRQQLLKQQITATNNTVLYVAIGFIVLMVIGLIILVIVKSKK